MQLLIILALLLYGGKSNAGNILSEVKPVLESIGGDEMREALKSAEQISTVLSAVQEMSGSANNSPNGDSPFGGNGLGEESFSQNGKSGSVNFPLAPVSAIADKDITYSLSKYISQN